MGDSAVLHPEDVARLIEQAEHNRERAGVPLTMPITALDELRADVAQLRAEVAAVRGRLEHLERLFSALVHALESPWSPVHLLLNPLREPLQRLRDALAQNERGEP